MPCSAPLRPVNGALLRSDAEADDDDVEPDNVEDGQASARILRAASQQEGDYFHRRCKHASL